MTAVKVIVSFGVWLGWSFYLWRKMRGDFSSRGVLKLSLMMVLAGLATGWVARSTWGVVIATVVLIIWWSKKNRWDVWEIMDEVVPAGFICLWVGVVIWREGVNWWYEGIIGLTGVIMGLIIKRNYKGYRWYKSGKIGLVGLFYLGWWSVREIGSGIVYSPNIRLNDVPMEELAGVWMLTAALVAVYLRSESNLFSNFKLWKKK